MSLLYVLSAVSFLVGILAGYYGIARNRRPQHYEGAALTWHEPQASIWQHDPILAVGIGLHGSGAVILATLFFLHIGNPHTKIMPTLNVITVGVVVSFIAGNLVVFPFAIRLAPDFPMSLFTNAVVRGQFMAEWHSFSHFTADPATHSIRLYSARTPEVARAIWHPPTDQLFSDVVTFLAQYLPTAMPPIPVPWHRRRTTLVVALLLSTLSLVLGGLIIYLLALGGAWVYFLGAIAVLLASGSWLLQKFEVT